MRNNQEIILPGSKSFTNRALVMAALADGKSRIFGYSASDDSRVLIEALRKIGVKISQNKKNLTVWGMGGCFPDFNGRLDMGMSGTACRFMAGLAALMPGRIILDGAERLRERPMAELFEALSRLGASIKYLNKKGFLPAEIRSGSLSGGEIALRGDISSQFFTALILIGPVFKNGLTIKVLGKMVSPSYIDMTLAGLKEFGVLAKSFNYKKYSIEPNQSYQSADYYVEGDASGASYFWALAALNNVKIKVKNINPSSTQGDVKFVDILARMGCQIVKNKKEKWISAQGPKSLRPVNVNMAAMPDTAQTLAVLAAFAKGKTKITGLATLKDKETNRLLALQNELAKMAIKSQVGSDFIVIEGGKPKSAIIDTYNDHRMAMAFAVAASKINSLKIKNPEVVAKSFPDFWKNFEQLGIKVEYAK